MNPECSECVYCVYDPYEDAYYCEADIDEDDISATYRANTAVCRYYRPYDEYGTVRKQN